MHLSPKSLSELSSPPHHSNSIVALSPQEAITGGAAAHHTTQLSMVAAPWGVRALNPTPRCRPLADPHVPAPEPEPPRVPLHRPPRKRPRRRPGISPRRQPTTWRRAGDRARDGDRSTRDAPRVGGYLRRRRHCMACFDTRARAGICTVSLCSCSAVCTTVYVFSYCI
jgi:hypothetical protein